MSLITKDDLLNYKKLIMAEKSLFNKFLESSNEITKVFYNEDKIVIQFRAGHVLTSDYLNGLHNLIEHSSYSVETVTVTKEFLKIKYDENILQLTITL